MSDETITELVTEVEPVDLDDTQPFSNLPERRRREWVPSVWAAPGTGGGAPKISGGYERDIVSGAPAPRAFNRPDQRYTQADATMQANRTARAAAEYSSSVILQGPNNIIEVRSSSGNNYDVASDLSNCDCPDIWRLRQSGKPSVTCKHIELARMALLDPVYASGLWQSAEKVAIDAGVSVEAVRAACQQGLITASKLHGVWAIPPDQATALVFIFTPLIPSIATVSPAGAAAGSGDTLVTITGENYCMYSRIVWDGVTALPTTVVSSSEVSATIPAVDLTSPGTFNVRVENAFRGGATSKPVDFIVS